MADSGNLLSEVFRYFNSGVLVFAMMILTYVTVFAVVNTANDGEVLGKKWSTFYTPLRTMTAATMLIPTSSGYAMIQMLLFYFVAASIAFASNMWEVAARYTFSDGADRYLISGVVDDRNFETLAKQAVSMQVCARAFEQAVRQTVLPPVIPAVGAASAARAATFNMELVMDKREEIHPLYGRSLITTFQYRDAMAPFLTAPLCGTMEFVSRYQQQLDERTIVENPDSIVEHFADSAISSFSLQRSNSEAVRVVVQRIQRNLNEIHEKQLIELFGEKGVAPIAKLIIDAVEEKDEAGEPIKAQEVAVKVRELQNSLYNHMVKSVREGVQPIIAGYGPYKSDVDGPTEELIERFTRNGWVWAGSLHLELARVKDAIRSASLSRHEFRPGLWTASTLSTGDVLGAQQPILDKYQKLTNRLLALASSHSARLDASAGQRTQVQPKFDSGFTWRDFATGGGTIRKNMERTFSSIGDSIVVGIINQMGRNDTHVLFQVKDIGDVLTTVSQGFIFGAITARAGLAAAGKTADVSTNITGVGVFAIPASGAIEFLKAWFDGLWQAMSPSAYVLLYVGYFMSIWLPAVPFLVMLLAVVGWVVACLESFIAGSLWVAAHTTPATDNSFIGSQQQGYLLIMSLFFRPVLIIFGLMASMTLLTPLVQFTNQAFILFFRMIQADSMIGLFTIAAYLLLYAVLLFSVFMTLFVLPQMLPNRILSWVGTNLYGDLGETGGYQKIEGTMGAQAKGAIYAGESKSAARRSAKSDSTNKQAQSEAERSKPPKETDSGGA